MAFVQWKTIRPPRRFRAIALGLGVVAVAIAAVPLTGAMLRPTAAQLAIQGVAKRGLLTELTAGIPPADLVAGRPATDAQMIEWRQLIASRLGQYFTGKRLAFLVNIIQTNIGAEADGKSRTISAAILAITFDAVNVNGAAATATGVVDRTAVLLDPGLDGALYRHSPPLDRSHFSLTLVLQNGKWLISDEVSYSLPGYGP